jgi:hypothetical protein
MQIFEREGTEAAMIYSHSIQQFRGAHGPVFSQQQKGEVGYILQPIFSST